MRTFHFCIAFPLALLMAFGSSLGADPHRVVVLDIGSEKQTGFDRHQVMVLGIESGTVLAKADLGRNTSIALSPKGDTVATLSYSRASAAEKGGNLFKLYRAGDLSLLQSSRLPETIPRGAVSQLGASVNIQLSPSGEDLILSSWKEPDAFVATTVVHRVKREVDDDGFLKLVATWTIKPCSSVSFVSTGDWPRVHVLNSTFTELQVLDVDTGRILSSLPLGGDGGRVIAGGGPYAYYIPRSGSGASLKKIDLSADAPKVIYRGDERQPDLRGIAAVSEAAKALFVLEERRNPQHTHEPSRWVKVFGTSDLSLQRQIELPLTDCQDLEVSGDGKYLYALDAGDGKLAVIETASARPVKVLDVGKYPLIMIAVPEGHAIQ